MLQHIQIVIWQKEESRISLGADIYNYIIVHQYGTDISHTSIDIIESGGSAKAVLISEVIVSGLDNGDDYRIGYLTGYRNSKNGLYCRS